MKTDRQKIGALGEELACRWLVSESYSIVGRNIQNKVGEIDIVARHNKYPNKLFFIEVKTIANGSRFHPLDNMTQAKLHKLHKTIITYLDQEKTSLESWQLDALLIRYDPKDKTARIEHHSNLY